MTTDVIVADMLRYGIKGAESTGCADGNEEVFPPKEKFECMFDKIKAVYLDLTHVFVVVVGGVGRRISVCCLTNS